MKRSIIWFKTDLRLHDNETLVEAIAHSDEVIPIYCLDENWDKQVGKFQKTGNFRKQFIIESLIDLDNHLREKGSGLWILKGNPSIEIPKFAALNEVHKVYTKKEIATEEKQLLVDVEQALWKHKCVLETFSTSTLYHAVDLPFAISQIPDMFTQFRKRTEHDSAVRPIFGTPDKIPSPVIPLLQVQYLDLPQLPIEKIDERAAVQFKGGETEALKRLNYYLFESKLLLKYKETRNGLIGGDYSSKLSPWLATGSISPRYIYHEIKKFETENQANESTKGMVEVILTPEVTAQIQTNAMVCFFIFSKFAQNYIFLPPTI
jgi:deoxyribodipyrimidine photo-lyase